MASELSLTETAVQPREVPLLELLWALLWRSIVTGAVGGTLLGGAFGGGLMLFAGVVTLLSDGTTLETLSIVLGAVGMGAGIGGLIGVAIGLPLGFLNGLLIGVFTRLFFYPLKNETRYKWGIAGLSLVTSAVGALLLVAVTSDGGNGAGLALLAAPFGAWMSRYPARWYISKSQSTISRGELWLWNRP